MPRIRKKTSKRGTTHQRARIKHKITEGRRKKKKEAKKNPQWKSKKKKDPGIPNEFPYKDQILAEVAQTRRQVEEAKQRRKEEKKAAREVVLLQDDAESAPPSEKSSSSKPQHKEAPLLLDPDLPNLKAVLDKADVVLHVLDARDPVSFRLAHLEEVVVANEHSELVFVLNKIDLVPRENLTAWAAHLRTQHPTFLFRAASAFLPKTSIPVDPAAKGKAKETAADAIGADALLAYLAQRADAAPRDTLRVAVVGITNTGKSALVNSLARTAAVPVYAPTPSADARSTTTPHALTVPVPAPAAGYHTPLTFLDTPGVALDTDTAGGALHDVLLRSRGRIDKLKDPVPAAAHIVARAAVADLMVHYGLPAFAAGDTTAFLAGVARARGALKKGGVPDAIGAARGVLRDWASGRLPFCADGPPATEAPAAEGDEAALAAVRTRKEMRRGAGIVRLVVPGAVETRRVELERMYEVGDEGEGNGEEESAAEEDREGNDDDESGDTDDDGGDSGANDGDADGADASEKDVLASSLRKRKRTASAPAHAARPAKKVSFASSTVDRQERKQARKAPKSAKTATENDEYDFGQFFK